MNKILLFGSSGVDPKFFNSRVLKLDQNDDYYFGNILGKATGIDNIQTFSISGAGNEWISSAVISQLDQIDKDTLVIISWSLIDRVDLVLGNEQIHYQEEIETGLPDQWKYLEFNKTFNASGESVSAGLRYWPTAHFFFSPKIKLKSFYSHAVQLKHYYEKVSLVQGLLEKTGCTQVHWNVADPASYTFDKLIKDLIAEATEVETIPKYKVVDFKQAVSNVEEEYPELVKWKELVDWSKFSEDLFLFYKRNNLPYACVDKYSSFHQTPINYYLYIREAILKHFKIPIKNEILEEMRIATEVHGKKYNTIYEYNDALVRGILS